MTLSDTQRQILTAATQHEARLATAPRGLPAAARNAVFRSMLKHGLLTEVPAPTEYVGLGWRQDEAGAWIALRLDPLWEQLFPAEQARIVRSLVERVVVGPAGADIRLRVEGLASLVRDLTAIAPDALRAAA
ncbi:hypothetical protein GCM10011504_50790 [Siccirubricoccus deserti]|uniref:hypothetical protein n=1 Tax=Siccirubricoccus deserti TaxID=2013562 RepID=UPI0019915F6C|nr:hypothetical protein [Siccirubricoccus deserti]GGC66644.1 hypothetical protein GCM10011504_50790 [Siccirubricoccus deserti]